MLNPWLTFGLTPEQEDRYRNSCLGADLAQARTCLLLLLLPVIGFAVNDYIFLGRSWPFYGMAALRLTLLVGAVALVRWTRTATAYRSYDRAEFAWGIFLVALLLLAAATRPQTFIVHAIVAVVTVFVTLLAVPNRFVHQLFLGLAIGGGETLIIVPSLWTSPQAAVSVILSLLMAVAVAIAIAHQLHNHRRQEFLAREREQEARAMAEAELAERKRAEGRLDELNQRLTYHVDNSPLAVIEWGPDMRLIRWTGAAERMFGWKAQEVLGKRMEDFRWIYPEDQLQVAEVSGELKSGTNPRRFSANRNYRKDGSVVHCEWHNSSLVDESGQLRSILSLVLDVTDRKRAEGALRQSVGELARSNADLEQFAYVSSHDLQEPLRMVTSFLKLLQDRYATQLDDRAREYIGYSVDGATRMSHLIKALLDYSRAGRKKEELRPVDVANPLAEAIANLRGSIEDTGAKVTCDDLPWVVGDASQLTQLFQNLIGNAVKFRHAGRPCQVHVSATQQEGKCVFAVRDNGIGIPPEQFDRIFVIFQRLHTREEYPGTGIGLAICKKIVERQGGRIWVESGAGEGATFCFALPAAAPASQNPASPSSQAMA